MSLQIRAGRAMRQHRTLGGWLHAIRHRSRWWRFRSYEHGCWLCRAMFAAINRDFPDFAEGTKRGKADADAHRLYKWSPERDGQHEPDEQWLPDDPSQPDGWHHDGTRWVLNDDGGWFQDTTGFWRYNHPGDPGWQEQPDGSWDYVKAAA